MSRTVGRRASQHRILMANDPPRELQCLVAIVDLGSGKRAIQDFACQYGGGRGLEVGDQLPRGDKALRGARRRRRYRRIAMRNRCAEPGCRPGPAA